MTERQTTGTAIMGPLLFAVMLLAAWFDHRGFLHGMAIMAQVWWLWSIRPRRTTDARHNEQRKERT